MNNQFKKVKEEIIAGLLKNPQLIVQVLQSKLGAQIMQMLVSAAEQGDKESAAIINAVLLVVSQTPSTPLELVPNSSPTSAKNGAKLRFLNSLKNQCAEDEELSYFKVGGKVCTKCMKKKLQAQKASCGTKVKKKCSGGISKAMEGIRIELAKCGNKIKKAEDGGNTKKYKTETARNLTRTISTTKDPHTGKVKSDTTIMNTGTLATYDSNSSGKRREYYEKANHDFEVLSGKNKKDATKSLTPKPVLKKCGGKNSKKK